MYQPDSLAVRLYQASPVFIQNLLFTAAGYKNYRDRFNHYFREYLTFLRESQWWDSEKIQLYQEERLKHIIQHAYNVSPYAKMQLDAVGIKPADIVSIESLKKIPLSSKDSIRDSGLKYHNTSLAKSKIRIGLTSGTSGRAFSLYTTNESVGKQWAVWTRHKERFGIMLGDKYLSFGARVPIDARQKHPPYWRINYASKQVYLSTFHFSKEYFPEIIQYIESQEFKYFTGYPSSMYVLAKYMEENNLTLKTSPHYVVAGSETLLPHFESVINKSFGAPVTEQYGVGEGCGNFSKCEKGRFHLDFEYGIAEFLDIPGESNPNLKRLVFTSLANEAMPLIRYDIGDYAELDDSPCSCGRKSITVRRIMGRLEDYIVTPDGRKVSGMNQVFEWAQTIREIQVVQSTASAIKVKYIPAGNFVNDDLKMLELEFRKRVGDEIRIEFLPVNEIQRTKSGKYKAVVSEIGKTI